MDAYEHGGVADVASDYGLDWCVHLKHGFEVRAVTQQ